MLNSKSFSKSLSPFILLVLVSCASLKKTGTVDPSIQETSKETVADQEGVPPQDAGNGSDNNISIIRMADPMGAVVLPAVLIQGYDQAKSLLAQNKFSQAEALLKRLHASHPSYSGPSYRLARIYQKQSKLTQSIEALDKAIVINPDNYFALNLKGKLLREKGQFDEAKVAYLQAIKIFPSYPNSRLNLAILADLYLHDLQLALQHYQSCLLGLTDDRSLLFY